MNKNIDLIKKIHEGADSTCYSAILRAWDLDDHPYSKENWCKKVEIHKLYIDSKLTVDQIAVEKGIKVRTVKKHIKQYEQVMKRIWLPEDINEEMFDRMYVTNAFYKKCQSLMDAEAEDTYFSLNSFWRTKKSAIDVRHINAFVLDFDFYKIKQYQDMSPSEFYNRKIKNKLPFTPTGVVDSGRGLYVIYSFHHCSYHMERLYKVIMQWFYRKFEGYGMDKLALNTTQVIRLPGTINTKSLKVVNVLHYKNTNYQIQDFASLLSFNIDEVQQHKRSKCKKLINSEVVKIKYEFTEAKKVMRKKYFEDFLVDVKKLITLRNRAGIYEGYREMLLYLVRERATWSGYDIDESIEIANDCNKLFHHTLSENAVSNQCRPSGGRKKSSIDTIIDKLNINITEQMEMRVLKRKWIKKSAYAKRRRKHTLLNMTDKKFEQLDRRTRICALKNERHINNTEIARILKVDKSTITRDIKYIQEHPAEFKKELQEYMDEMERERHSDIFKRGIIYEKQKQLLKWLELGYTALEYMVRVMGVAIN